ncbi:MAG: GldG family protein, partial [Silvanigrellaceae bacterium]|nr:GldG family protein [Silvanigrellaceae bacterium]
MKKFKLEFFVASIFLALLSLLLSERINVFYEYLSYILSGVFFVIAIGIHFFIKKEVSVSNGENNEKYAPKYLSQAVVSGIFAITIILGITILLNKPNFSTSFDLTKNKVNSLSQETITFLSALDKDVEIFCVPSSSPVDNYCDSSRDLLMLYSRKSPHIINYSQVDLRDRALLEKIQPSGFSRLILMTSDNKSELSGQISESKLTNAVLNLIKFKKTVYFLSGHGEPSLTPAADDRSYSRIVEDLNAKTYQTKEWDVKQGDLPGEAEVLIAGDAQLAYGPDVEGILRRFVARGGKLIVVQNPYREQGLSSFFKDIGLELPPQLLTLNQSTPIGKEIANQSSMRPPVVVSDFNISSEITRVIAQSMRNGVMLVDGARPIVAQEKNAKPGIQVVVTPLMSALAALPITLSVEQRNKIDPSAPFLLKPDQGSDPKKAWPVAFEVDIHEASLLNPGYKGEGNKKVDEKNKSKVVVFGFSVVGPLSRPGSINQLLLTLSVAHLYEDKELVTIPPRDVGPKEFNLNRNPSAYLALFAGLLPITTAVIGFFIWM